MNPNNIVLFTIPLLGKPFAITLMSAFGLLGNVLFTGRVLVQWIASERKKQSIVPVAFWWMSLAASAIFLVYTVAREDIPMFLGIVVTIIPYVRNLRIHYAPDRPPRPRGLILIVAAVLMLMLVITYIMAADSTIVWEIFWIGVLGNAIFQTRFLVQWIHSEARRKSELPPLFWWQSVTGSLILLLYAFLRGDFVFLLSFTFAAVPAIRNLMLIRRHLASLA